MPSPAASSPKPEWPFSPRSRPKGHPHLVPCCFALDGDTIYSAVDEVKPKATLAVRRLENVRSRPAVSLLVHHDSEDWSALW